MKDNILITDSKHKMDIFRSLMKIEYHRQGEKTREELLRELEELAQGKKLKILRPEK
jgi:hypothetical protein